MASFEVLGHLLLEHLLERPSRPPARESLSSLALLSAIGVDEEGFREGLALEVAVGEKSAQTLATEIMLRSSEEYTPVATIRTSTSSAMAPRAPAPQASSSTEKDFVSS